jgi:hypothetical protein
LSKKRRKYQQEKISWLAWAIALVSFIPLIGVPFGISAIAWGASKWSTGGKKLAALGAGGILLTVVIYSCLFLQLLQHEKSGTFDRLRVEMAQDKLYEVVKSLEYHKLTQGNYPASLEELVEQTQDYAMILDSTGARHTTSNGKSTQYFYYQLDPAGEHYYLLSVGADGQPFTRDDILPDVSGEDLENVGYREK